jgi:ribosomal protein S18 acetylase RimI-like enzyme
MNIQPITRQTYHQAAQVLGQAFMVDPVSMAVYKSFSSARMLRSLVNDFRAEIKVCLQRAYPIQVNEGDRLLGAAVIYPPGCYPLPRFQQWRLLIQSVLENGFYDIRGWSNWLDEVDRYHPTEPHYYLEYIGVQPECQRQGVGKMIMQHMLARADEDQVGCHLENGNPRNLPYYQRFGFQVTKELDILGLKTWLMWRPPGESTP